MGYITSSFASSFSQTIGRQGRAQPACLAAGPLNSSQELQLSSYSFRPQDLTQPQALGGSSGRWQRLGAHWLCHLWVTAQQRDCRALYSYSWIKSVDSNALKPAGESRSGDSWRLSKPYLPLETSSSPCLYSLLICEKNKNWIPECTFRGVQENKLKLMKWLWGKHGCSLCPKVKEVQPLLNPTFFC